MALRVAKCESSQPTTPAGARPMKGLYALKPWFTGRLTPIVDAAVARKVSPDVFTAAGCGGGGRGRAGHRCRVLATGDAVSRLEAGRRQPRRRGCPRPRSEPTMGIRRQRDRRPLVGSPRLRRARGMGGAAGWPRDALVVMDGDPGAGCRGGRDAAHIRIAGGSGRRRAAAQRRPARQDRTLRLHGAGHRLSGPHAGDPRCSW